VKAAVRNLFDLLPVIVPIVVFVLIVMALAFRPDQVVTGKIVKLWTQNAGRDGDINYIGVETTDGRRWTIKLSPMHYGWISVGENCTFSVDPWGWSTSASCQPSKDDAR
jgi:hypothetical protein